jgi:signal transduction histidine kinase
MLLDGDFGELRPEIKKSLEVCFSAAAEMDGNIETFLNLNKLEAGKLEVHEQKIDLQEIVADCLADFNPRAKEKNIVLVFQKKDDLPEVFADKFQIRHVINNLISNAIKYTLENGAVTVRLDEDKKSNNLIFTIEDTGIGIPPDILPHLFSRYERGGEKAKSISEGSGVGLFLAKEIIEMHHGRIWAKSKGSGKGSRFSFSLPLKPINGEIKE